MNFTALREKLKINQHKLNIVSRFAAEAIGRASSLITFPIVARYLSSEGYGVQSQINTITNLLVAVASLGLGFSVVRLIAGKSDVKYVSQRFFSTLVMVTAVSTAMMAAIMLFAPWINETFFKVSWATPVIRWAAPLVPLITIEQTLKEYLRARLRIAAYSAAQIAQTFVDIGAALSIMFTGGGLLSIIIITNVSKTILNLLLFIYFLRTGEVRFNQGWMPRQELMDMLRFGLPIIATTISTRVINVGDRTIIGYFMTSRDVGVYTAAYSFAGLIGALASPFWSQLYPLMAARKNHDDRNGLVRVCRKYNNAYLMLGLPALFGLTAIAPMLLETLGTSEFAVSSFMFGMIALGLFFSQFNIASLYLAYIYNEPTFLLIITVATALENILLNVVLIPYTGIVGAAIATLASYATLNLLLARRIRRHGYSVEELHDFNTISKYAIGALVMGLVLFFTTDQSQKTALNLARTVIIGVAAYALTLWTLYGFNYRKILEKI